MLINEGFHPQAWGQSKLIELKFTLLKPPSNMYDSESEGDSDISQPSTDATNEHLYNYD